MACLLLVEEQVAYREAFAAALKRCTGLGLSIVLQAGDLAEAKEAIARSEERIDVALIGRDLTDGAGVEFRRHLQGFHPACQLIVMGIGQSRSERARAIAIGAAGIFPRTATLAAIADGIRRLLAGESLIPRTERIALLRESEKSAAEEQAIRNALSRLTPREREILDSLAHGMSDKETAALLGVSTKTVATHMASLLDKLGVDSRLKAVLTALRFRVVSLN